MVFYRSTDSLPESNNCSQDNGGCHLLCLPTPGSRVCTHAPQIKFTCPENIEEFIELGTKTKTTISWKEPGAVDYPELVNLEFQSRESGSSFAVGNTTVTYRFIDDSGKRTSCQFNVTVKERPFVPKSDIIKYTAIAGSIVLLTVCIIIIGKCLKCQLQSNKFIPHQQSIHNSYEYRKLQRRQQQPPDSPPQNIPPIQNRTSDETVPRASDCAYNDIAQDKEIYCELAEKQHHLPSLPNFLLKEDRVSLEKINQSSESIYDDTVLDVYFELPEEQKQALSLPRVNSNECKAPCESKPLPSGSVYNSEVYCELEDEDKTVPALSRVPSKESTAAVEAKTLPFGSVYSSEVYWEVPEKQQQVPALPGVPSRESEAEVKTQPLPSGSVNIAEVYCDLQESKQCCSMVVYEQLLP